MVVGIISALACMKRRALNNVATTVVKVLFFHVGIIQFLLLFLRNSVEEKVVGHH